MNPTRFLRNSAFRLAVLYMSLFGVSVLVLFAYLYWSTAGYLRREAIARIESDVSDFQHEYRTKGIPGVEQFLEERMRPNPYEKSVYLLADWQSTPIAGSLSRWPTADSDGGGWLRFQLPGVDAKTGEAHAATARIVELGAGFKLLVGEDTYEADEMEELIAGTAMSGLAITLLLALCGGAFMSYQTTRRIELISRTSRQIMSGELSRRIPLNGSSDDFDQLAQNLNAMLDRIEFLMAEIREVSLNVAHDLRTPLTRLRNRLELAQDEPRDVRGARLTIDEAMVEADKLLGLINALLRITEIESGNRRPDFAEIELETVLDDAITLYEPVIQERGQTLTTQVDRGVLMRVDRNLLFQGLINLLDNAVKYTPEGGTIAVSLVRDRGRVRIEVADSGPGIPESARTDVFKRFFRLESSRTTPGNGLGLSLVAAVAHLHGAEVQLEDNGPGLRAQMVFQQLA